MNKIIFSGLSLIGYEKNTSFIRFMLEPIISIFGIEDNSESFATGKIMGKLLSTNESKKSLFEAMKKVKQTGDSIEIDGTGIKITQIGSNKSYNEITAYK